MARHLLEHEGETDVAALPGVGDEAKLVGYYETSISLLCTGKVAVFARNVMDRESGPSAASNHICHGF